MTHSHTVRSHEEGFGQAANLCHLKHVSLVWSLLHWGKAVQILRRKAPRWIQGESEYFAIVCHEGWESWHPAGLQCRDRERFHDGHDSRWSDQDPHGFGKWNWGDPPHCPRDLPGLRNDRRRWFWEVSARARCGATTREELNGEGISHYLPQDFELKGGAAEGSEPCTQCGGNPQFHSIEFGNGAWGNHGPNAWASGQASIWQSCEACQNCMIQNDWI